MVEGRCWSLYTHGSLRGPAGTILRGRCMIRAMRCLILSTFAMACISCIKDPFAPPPGYVRDDLYCWHRDADGRWRTRGLSHECPDNTPYGTPVE